MPKKSRELSALEVKRLTRPGAHAVGFISGLQLVVKNTGAKSWVLRTMIGNNRRNIGLGGYPEVSLAEAREKAREAKKLIEQGIDPIEEKKTKKRALMALPNRLTFAQAAISCHKQKSSEFKSDKHAKQWISVIKRYANPTIGDLPVDEIELSHILSVLEPIWHEKTETATRLRQRIEAVLSWATVSGHRTGDNPARWQGHLDAVLPKPGKLKKVKHHSALPWQQIGLFMPDLRKRKGTAARCLEFIILTACRSGEARLATWDEIDLENKTWTVPADRMKTGKEHTVPLTKNAVDLLKALPRFEGSPYVFPAPRGGPLLDLAISSVCRRMEVEAVPHGFRSSFRDWCSENTNFPREVAEMALAHTIESKVEAAYRRGDLFEKRRRLMEAWNDFCNTVWANKSTTVTPIQRTG